MYDILGPHVNQTWGGIPEMVATWKPPVALILDHSPAWEWVKRESPNTLMVGRWFMGEPPSFENVDPVAYARAELAPLLKTVAVSPYDYIAGVNEPVANSKKAMRNLALYDIERMKILATVGKKAAIFGLATGNPSDMSVLMEYLPALEAAVQYKAVLHMHEYDWPTIGANDKWLPYRHEFFYEGCPDHNWAGVPEKWRVPIIVTEFGLDAGTVMNGVLVGWRGAGISAQEYMSQLQMGNKRLMQSPYVLGACIFCTGNASQNWAMFDFWPEVKELASAATPQYRKYSPPTEEPVEPKREIFGIDVSYWQSSNFSFKKARADGVRFVIMRASVGQSIDQKLGLFWRKAALNDMKVGIYHYLNVDNAMAQARLFAEIAKRGEPCPMGYFLDVEAAGLNATKVLNFRKVFEEESGLHLDYYSSGSMWSKLVGRCRALEDRPMKWIADYRNIERFGVPVGFRRADVKIRQFTSGNNGWVPSYKSRLDINRWLGTAEEFEAL